MAAAQRDSQRWTAVVLTCALESLREGVEEGDLIPLGTVPLLYSVAMLTCMQCQVSCPLIPYCLGISTDRAGYFMLTFQAKCSGQLVYMV